MHYLLLERGVVIVDLVLYLTNVEHRSAYPHDIVSIEDLLVMPEIIKVRSIIKNIASV